MLPERARAAPASHGRPDRGARAGPGAARDARRRHADRSSTTGMIMQAADVFRYWAGWATKIHGFTSPSMQPGEFLGYTLREPLGVVGGITPWNGPFIMAAWKTAPALACGNTVVLKPAEHTPMTAMELARIAADAGLPEGVLNVVPGFGPTAGAALAQHPGRRQDRLHRRVRHRPTGRADVDVEPEDGDARARRQVAAHHLRRRRPRDRGRERALRPLHQHRADLLGRHAAARAGLDLRPLRRALRRALEADQGRRTRSTSRPAWGPLVSEEQLRKVERYVEIGQREGARLVCGGGRPKDADARATASTHEPTVFADVDQQDADRAGGDLRPGRRASSASATRTTRCASATT